MNKKNDWGLMAKAYVLEGPVEKVTREEIAIATKAVKPEKAAGPSEVCAKMISASGEVRIGVMMELCQLVLDGKGMPNEWQTSVLEPIFKRKGDERNCNTYRGVKLLEHAMKIVDKVLERWI